MSLLLGHMQAIYNALVWASLLVLSWVFAVTFISDHRRVYVPHPRRLPSCPAAMERRRSVTVLRVHVPLLHAYICVIGMRHAAASTLVRLVARHSEAASLLQSLVFPSGLWQSRLAGQRTQDELLGPRATHGSVCIRVSATSPASSSSLELES